MSTEQKPAVSITTCDACGCVCTSNNFRMGTHFSIQRSVLDMYNQPAANGSVAFDFCDTCAPIITDAINATVKGIREKAA